MSGKLTYPKTIEPCSPTASRTIFDGPGQKIDCDPASIRLISDRVLIRDIPQDDERRGSLFIPESSQQDGVGKGGLIRVGVVVAVGAGDRFQEHGLDVQGAVRRTLLTKPCGNCEDGQVEAEYTEGPYLADCGICGGSGHVPVTVPAQCKVGDKVLYDRRREAEVIIGGVRFALVHSEQSVIAVLED